MRHPLFLPEKFQGDGGDTRRHLTFKEEGRQKHPQGQQQSRHRSLHLATQESRQCTYYRIAETQTHNYQNNN